MNDTALQQPRDHYIESRGLRLHYAEWGDPQLETLLLVHGNRDQCRSWDFFVAEIQKLHPLAFHIVALDLRGHGESEWNPACRGYRHEDFLFDLSAAFYGIGKEKINLVGHSLGGSISTLFAGCFPDRIKNLILVEAIGPYSKQDDEVPDILAEQVEGKELNLERTFHADLEEAAAAVKKRFSSIPDDVCTYMARFGTRKAETGLVWKHDPRLRVHSLSPLSENQVRAFIRRISSPTLIVYGSDSGFTKSSRISRLSLFSKAKVVEFPATGHHVPHERPVELARMVSSFLFADQNSR
ncbi:MAG: alpha/beta fold hydrolase [Candidatus Binatia bacterium]